MNSTRTVDQNSALRDQLQKILDWQDAHANFDAAVKDFPARMQGARPEGFPHSGWQLLEHMRLTQEDILDFCRNPDYEERKWPDEYWPKTPEPPSPKSWQESVAAYERDRDDFKKLTVDPNLDLFATIPHGTGQTYLREILLVADHTSYHVGQLIMLRKQLGVWEAA